MLQKARETMKYDGIDRLHRLAQDQNDPARYNDSSPGAPWLPIMLVCGDYRELARGFERWSELSHKRLDVMARKQRRTAMLLRALVIL